MTAPEKPLDVQPAAEPGKLRLKAILLVVLPVVLLAFGVLALVTFTDTDTLWDNLTRPKLVPVHGQLMYQGQPLRKAQIMTSPDGGRGKPSLGWTDDDGKFTLQTDIRGQYVDGATVGEHRVAVMAYQMVAAPVAPPLLTPQQYSSVQTTPLHITVSRNPTDNEFNLVLEGEPASKPMPERKSNPGRGNADDQPAASNEPAAGNEPAASEGEKPQPADSNAAPPAGETPPTTEAPATNAP